MTATTDATREFFFFHLMPYPEVPEDATHLRHGMHITNALLDPEVGHRMYNDYLDEMEFAEQVGFDGVCCNEHHQTMYGQMPAPNIIGAALARRTDRVKIALLGNAIGLEDKSPIKVAEEVAMLDLISGGRVISGFVRGIGNEYFNTMSDPSRSRERFYEAHDLIIKAWTKPGPWSYDGKHYTYRYVNPTPLPYQKPHPPIWFPSQGSSDTIDFAARNGYTYCSVYVPVEQIKFWLDQYRRVAEDRYGYEAGDDQVGFLCFIYVDDTDEKAMASGRPHMEYFFKRLIGAANQHTFNINQQIPPGYLTEASFKGLASAMMGGTDAGPAPVSKFNFDYFLETRQIYIGSPETVREQLEETLDLLQPGVVAGLFQVGDMPKEKVLHSTGLFAEQVMPKLRQPLKRVRPELLGRSELTRDTDTVLA